MSTLYKHRLCAPTATAASTPGSATPILTCTHIYPLQVTVGLRRRHHSIVGVDDGHDVHAQQLLQGAVQVLPLLVIVEIQICHEDLTEEEDEVTLNKIQTLLLHFSVIILWS